jgi:hypothetical protein
MALLERNLLSLSSLLSHAHGQDVGWQDDAKVPGPAMQLSHEEQTTVCKRVWGSEHTATIISVAGDHPPLFPLVFFPVVSVCSVPTPDVLPALRCLMAMVSATTCVKQQLACGTLPFLAVFGSFSLLRRQGAFRCFEQKKLQKSLYDVLLLLTELTIGLLM